MVRAWQDVCARAKPLDLVRPVIIFTMLRSVLILNGIYDYGRSIWSGDTEGTGFLRFYAVLYTVVGAPGIELLRGGAVTVPPARLTGIRSYVHSFSYCSTARPRAFHAI